jgi:hypothetical protein
MLIEPIPLPDTTPVNEPGHFEGFVGVRLVFATDTNAALDGPSASMTEALNSDVAGDTAGPLGDLVAGVNDLQRGDDLGDMVDIVTASNDLEADLIDQSTQVVPDAGTAPAPEGGAPDAPPIEVPLPTSPGPPAPPEPEPLP